MIIPISPSNSRSIEPDDEIYWQHVRSQFMPETSHIYLNNASLGMPPKAVYEAVSAGFERLSENPSCAKRELGGYIDHNLRPALAEFLGADTGEIALSRNATEGMYHIVNGLDLNAGDRVVITSQEHPGALKPWLVRAERDGIDLKVVDMPSPLVGTEDIVARISDAIDDRTKVVFFCHVTRGGYLYPIKRLCKMAAECGVITAIDGAQAVGMLPVDLHDLGCDFYANSLHKWFLGPSGTGFLYVRSGMLSSLQSLYLTTDETEGDGRRYEIQGTYDLPVRAALGTSLDFLNRIGIQNIERRLRMLSDYLREALSGMDRVCLLTAKSHEISSPGSTIFELDGIDPTTWPGSMVDEEKIHIDDHHRDGHLGLRISTHYYTTFDDIDRCLDVLKKRIASA